MNTMEALERLPDEKGLGVVYWEPEVASGLLPDKYFMGASRLVNEHTLQFTKALSAYRTMKHRRD